MLETITLEAAIKFSTPYAKKLFNDKIKPLITNKIEGYFKTKNDINKFEQESVKYISRIAGQCSTINTIAFPNTPKKLDELYIPLTLKDENKNELIINDDVDIFRENNKILINDTAGMGKSTISKKILNNIIDKKELIPIFIELRHLTKEPLAKQITKLFGVNTESPEEILNNLPLVYLFDGLDEISSDSKSYIIDEIRKFIDQIEDPKILITSRLESYLSDFYDFSRFTIKPLSQEEAYDLISKYDPQGDISKKLTEGIKQSDDRGLIDFLSTPLYVSLLFCAYRYKTIIPQKRHLFYSQVYEALFESHDLSKEIGFVRQKNSNLDSSEFHLILRRLGFWCLKNGGKIEFQKDELEIAIREILSCLSSINTNSVKFVKDLTTTVPLFIKEGSNLRWSHKSLMEYFAAMFICHDTKGKQQEILLHLYQSENWSSYKNIIELCADIDFMTFRRSVVKKVLEDFITYHDNNYQNIKNKRIKKSDIETRISVTFHCSFGFRLTSMKSYDMNNKDFWNFSSPDIDEVKNTIGDKYNQIGLMISGLKSREAIIRFVMALSKENMIIKILNYKCPHVMASSTKPSFEVRENITTLKKDKLFIVNDFDSNILNKSKYFATINSWLTQREIVGLDYEKAILELKTIETECSNGIDKLIGDLF